MLFAAACTSFGSKLRKGSARDVPRDVFWSVPPTMCSMPAGYRRSLQQPVPLTISLFAVYSSGRSGRKRWPHVPGGRGGCRQGTYCFLYVCYAFLGTTLSFVFSEVAQSEYALMCWNSSHCAWREACTSRHFKLRVTYLSPALLHCKVFCCITTG